MTCVRHYEAFQVARGWRPRLPMQETPVCSLGGDDPLEEEMATCSSIPAWRIPWTEELGGLQSTGSLRVRHDWATEHSNITQRIFPAPRPLCSTHSLTSTDFFLNCLHSFAFSSTSYSWNYTVFSDWLSSLSSNMPLGFRNTCSHDSIAHFILALADVPPSGCASAHLFTNWRASWLLPSLGNYE